MENEIQDITPKKNGKKGILLIALGNPMYGIMALNLAMSLKAQEKVSIALVYSMSAITQLDEKQLSFFDERIECDEKIYNGNDYLRAKLFIYDLSPFDTTMFLDVDTLWLPKHKPSDLFKLLKDVDFTFENRGHELDWSYWANMDDAKAAYDIQDKKYYQIHSEFFYFKKTADVKKFFKTAQKVYDKPKVEVTKFANNIPDEFAFAVSAAINELYPHQDNFVPGYWYPYEKVIHKPAFLYHTYYFMSIGGAGMLTSIMETYNNLVKHYHNIHGLRHPKNLKNKRSYLPERSKI